MIPLTEQLIRASFVNASRKEVADVSFPLDFADVDWGRHDYYGWRDRRIARRGYAVVELDGRVVALLLRQSGTQPRSRPQCSWCQDVELTNEVVFYSAKRAGDAGRKGDTVGTLVCADFGCSANVRKKLPIAYLGFDVEAARRERIAVLGERARGFATSVLHGASA